MWSNQTVDYFDPVDYSVEELQFIIANAGEPAVVALGRIEAKALPEPARGKDGRIRDKNPVYYPGANPNAIGPLFRRINELQDLEAHSGEHWCGVEAVKAAAQKFLTENAKWAKDTKRGAPRWPSLYSFDSKGRPHRDGPGSDSGKVRTYFTEDGQRKAFRIPFIPLDLAEGAAEWANRVKADDPDPKGGLLVDHEKNRIECLICNHTEQFKSESRSSFNAARARMSRHLRSAKTETAAHREVHTNEFGSK
jgi:hypothetical protein